MRVLLAIVFAAVALPVVAVPTAAAGSGAAVKGVGGGWVGFMNPPFPFATSRKYAQFSLSAHQGPNGDFGQATISISDEFGFPFDLWAKLDCVNVFPQPPFRGGMWASGVATKVNDPTGTYFISPGDRVYFSAYDGGEPSAGPVDSFNAWYDLGVSCYLLEAYLEPPDVQEGNIVISADFTR